MTRRQGLWAGAAAGCAALLLAAGLGLGRSDPKTAPPDGGPARNRVHALGRLEPAGRVLQVAAPSGNDGACVEKLLVAEGDEVRAGDVLATLDNEARRAAALREAQARLESARARLAQVQAGSRPSEIDAQRAAVDMLGRQKEHAQAELTRALQLRQGDAVSQQEVEDRQWEFARVSLEHARARHQLDTVRDVRDTDVRLAEADVGVAAAAVELAAAELQATRVVAPSDGCVLKVHARPGEKPGDRGLLELGRVDCMHAVAEVFEADVLRLAPGLQAEVLLDCTGERLKGSVVELGHLVGRKSVLSNDPVSDTDARVLEVRVLLDPGDSRKVRRLSNARVEVTIFVSPGGGT